MGISLFKGLKNEHIYIVESKNTKTLLNHDCSLCDHSINYIIITIVWLFSIFKNIDH
jgi:hypothetical protein